MFIKMKILLEWVAFPLLVLTPLHEINTNRTFTSASKLNRMDGIRSYSNLSRDFKRTQKIEPGVGSNRNE